MSYLVCSRIIDVRMGYHWNSGHLRIPTVTLSCLDVVVDALVSRQRFNDLLLCMLTSFRVQISGKLEGIRRSYRREN